MKRKSLPGIDELFGTPNARSGPPVPAPEADHPPAPRWEDREAEVAASALRQLTADEGTALRTVRANAQHLELPSPEVGALLRWAVALCGARAVVEIGSAGGLTGLWMLGGMPDTGVLTSLEPDGEGHRLASAAFAEFARGSRVRTIHGDPGTMLERLADDSYDLVLLQTALDRYPDHLASAKRLLRPGGMLVARHVLPVGEHEQALVRFVHDLVEDPGLGATVLPLDGGVALVNVTRS